VIPSASITAWRKAAPWGDNTQIEQDLVLSRALVELFSRPVFAKNAVFRGGTALHKLFFCSSSWSTRGTTIRSRPKGPATTNPGSGNSRGGICLSSAVS
jgi:hypothetical protein